MRRARVAAAALVAAVALLVAGTALWLLDDPSPPTSAGPAVVDAAPADAPRGDARVRRGESAADVVAVTGARIVGTVSDAAGAPVAGAEVSLWTRGIASPRPIVDKYGSVREDDGPPLVTAEAPRGRCAGTASASDGSFVLAGIPPGTFILRAADAARRSGSRGLLLPPGLAELRADVVLVDDGAWSLDVHVALADGRPFSGLLGVEPDPAFTSAPDIRWQAVDAAGTAHFAGIAFRQLRLVAAGADGWHERSNPIALPHEGVLEWTLGVGLGDVRGTVRDVDSSAPIAGATVRVRDERGVRETRTDDAGAFAVGAGLTGSLRVVADGYGVAQRALGDAREIHVLLAGTGTVSGRVTRLSDGALIAGTTVWAGDWLDPATPRGLTGDDGTFHVTGVPAGLVWMRVHGDGWVTPEEHGRASWRAAEVATGGVASCDLVAMETGRIEGRVIDPDGRGVAAAYVSVGERDHGNTQDMRDVATVSDAEGYFVLDGLIRANQPKYVCRAEGFPVVRGDAPRVYAGTTASLDIELSRPLWMDVSVVMEADARPVAGALVSVRRVEPGLGHHHVATAATTADGTARLGPLAPGQHWVNAVAPGVAEVKTVRIDVRSDTESVVVVMTPGLDVSGVVLRDGEPQPYVAVQLVARPFPSATRTDAAGSFRFRGLRPGDVRLSADVGGREARATAPAGARDVRLELEAPSTPAAGDSEDDAPRATVEVHAPDGSPLAHFKWKVIQAQGDSWKSRWDTERGGVASYEVDHALPDRTLIVWEARDSGGRLLPLRVVTTRIPDGPPDVFTFTLPSTTPTITGRVVDAGGAIVAGGFVHAVHGGADRSSDVRRETIAMFPVDATGAFRVEGFDTDTVRLVAVPPPAFTLSPYTDATRGAGDVELRVGAAVRAEITVVDEEGRPVPGTTLYVEDEFDFDRRDRPRIGVEGFSDDVVAHARTGVDGRAVLERLDPSFELELRVHPPSRDSVAVVDIPDEDGVWTPQDTTIVLRSKAAITGVVRLADGSPAGSATIYVREGDSAHGRGVAADGSFRFSGVAAGSRSMVFAELAGGARSEEVEAGTDAPVVLTIDPGPHVTLRVADYRSGFMAPVYLAPNPYLSWSRTHLQGEVVLSMLDVETAYTVLVGPDDEGLCALLEHVVADGGVRTVELLRGAPVAGTLRPPEGFLGSVEVHLARGDHPLAEARIDHTTGTPSGFSFAGVPPGDWSVIVRRRHGDQAIVARREITVPLRPGETLELAW